MNNVDLFELENKRLEILKKYKIDEENIEEYRKDLESNKSIVTEEGSNNLGKELYNFIKSANYKDSQDDLKKVKEYVYKGANIEYSTDVKRDFSLLLCARRNLINTFILLVQLGADINKVNEYKTTPAMTSARHGNKEILEILILLKADINAQCRDGDNALISAKRHDQKECFEILKKANAYFGTKNLLNQTVKDIPSNEEYDFSGFFTFEECLPTQITFKKTQEVLNEATRILNLLTDGKLNNQTEPKKNKLLEKK